ncbi:MAG TPA: vitamin K epoxide reductase family protein [Candidatus Paceibacterota bacterium]|nr:vitamin K epoxide reductase family protein [Candidatus Paceibacterota bacterium]
MFNLTPFALLFTLACIGISESAYLIRKRRAAEHPVCPIGQHCGTVLSSRYNRFLPGIHNDVLGLLFYASFAVIMALMVILPFPPSYLPVWAFWMLAGATCMSVALIFIQWRILKAWCFWCIMSAGTVFLMDLIALGASLT